MNNKYKTRCDRVQSPHQFNLSPSSIIGEEEWAYRREGAEVRERVWVAPVYESQRPPVRWWPEKGAQVSLNGVRVGHGESVGQRVRVGLGVFVWVFTGNGHSTKSPEMGVRVGWAFNKVAGNGHSQRVV
ncbi:hypothetical protein Adt_35142 [Abeliophyllum distichum]|uniref:Uncharacterized protein n=1 Tax=Abeliophyllum distichum TaxID=126358 RepID=A0ABD1QE55_9LAMI